MNTSDCKEQQKKEDVARTKVLKEEEVASGKSSTDSVKSGSEPDYRIFIPLGWVSL
jgi:hypothetical protein